MRIVGHGVDLVEVARIARLVEAHGDRFLTRCYMPGELAHADARPKRRTEHLAARFAVKEAVLKALGTGWSGGILWTDVEVCSDARGKPTLALHGEAARIARELGAQAWSISITHAAGLAVASAIATGGD